jgi:hypothetical protein
MRAVTAAARRLYQLCCCMIPQLLLTGAAQPEGHHRQAGQQFDVVGAALHCSSPQLPVSPPQDPNQQRRDLYRATPYCPTAASFYLFLNCLVMVAD